MKLSLTAGGVAFLDYPYLLISTRAIQVMAYLGQFYFEFYW